jgi:hypothetical protein
MPYKVTIDGFEVSCDTADELLAAISIAGSRRRRILPHVLAPTAVGTRPPEPDENEPLSLPIRLQFRVAGEFLKTIRDSHEPVKVEDLVNVLNLAGPKGVGGISGTVNRVLERIDLPPDQVYDTRRTPRGRVWLKGPLLDEALMRLSSVESSPELFDRIVEK